MTKGVFLDQLIVLAEVHGWFSSETKNITSILVSGARGARYMERTAPRRAMK